MLRKAVNGSPKDPQLPAALGYVEQKRGATSDARALYEQALKQDPTLLEAATNLGVLDAKSGELREAVRLWESAFQRAPGRSGIGVNLARAFCGAGQIEEARNFAMRVLQFNPDLTEARKLLNGLNATPPKCSP